MVRRKKSKRMFFLSLPDTSELQLFVPSDLECCPAWSFYLEYGVKICGASNGCQGFRMLSVTSTDLTELKQQYLQGTAVVTRLPREEDL